jgi:hypothetical protein
VSVAEDTNVTAAAINDEGDIAGFATNKDGVTEGFLVRPNGTVIHLDVPGASATTALGVNNGDEVVGNYTDSSGMHGFAWLPGFGFETVNATTINGLNDRGELVGFYEDSSKTPTDCSPSRKKADRHRRLPKRPGRFPRRPGLDSVDPLLPASSDPRSGVGRRRRLWRPS